MGTAGPLALARDILDDGTGDPFFVLNRYWGSNTEKLLSGIAAAAAACLSSHGQHTPSSDGIGIMSVEAEQCHMHWQKVHQPLRLSTQ